MDRAGGKNSLLLLMPVVLLVYASMMPSEVRVTLAGQTLFPARIVGFLLLPVIFGRLVRDPVRINPCDILVFVAALWMTLAFSLYYGVQDGFARGAALSLNIMIPYLVARACIRNLTDLRRLLVLVAPGLLIAGSSMMLEVIAGRPLVRPAFASIFGQMQRFEGGAAAGALEYGTERRLGILRAAGPFAHPIHAGLFLASFLPLFWFSGLRKWPFGTGLFATCFTVFSASSAAYLGLIAAIGLLFTDWLQRIVTFLSWKLIIPAVSGLAAVLHMGTENGLIPFLTQYTLNPATAHYRRLIWRFGVASVERNPWIGIGFDGYERLPWMISSIDNHWLMVAIRSGILPAVLLFVAVLGAILMLSMAAARQSEIDRRLLVGVAISLFTVTLFGFSVAFWAGIETWFYILLGLSVGLGASCRGTAEPVSSRRPATRPLPLVRRAILKREPGHQSQR